MMAYRVTGGCISKENSFQKIEIVVGKTKINQSFLNILGKTFHVYMVMHHSEQFWRYVCVWIMENIILFAVYFRVGKIYNCKSIIRYVKFVSREMMDNEYEMGKI